jgi:hypothetical protein
MTLIPLSALGDPVGDVCELLRRRMNRDSDSEYLIRSQVLITPYKQCTLTLINFYMKAVV